MTPETLRTQRGILSASPRLRGQTAIMTLSRRELLTRCTLGVGAFALGDLMSRALADEITPLAPRSGQFPGRAKRMIHIFPNGGASHVDTFDPKPALNKYAGKPLPTPNLRTERKTGAAYPSPFKFSRCGQSGLEISDAFPKLRGLADDLCVIRSLHTEVPNHEPSLLMMNCGDIRFSRPSMGSWLTYGLGSENQNLPGFVALCPGGYPIQESQNWQSAFLPGAYQGTFIDSQHTELPRLIENIRNDSGSTQDQREQLDLLMELNRRHQEKRHEEGALEARIQSFELAYRMQMEAADAFDLSQEPKAILDLYGPGTQARQMLMARRLLERGVRFVQVWAGAGQPWDNHDKIQENVSKLAGASDQAIAALLGDLKQRGMLEDTLVLWAGEFGRTPTAELPAATGRDHNPYGFSVWLAGGGAKGGMAYGSTDEFGFKAQDNPVHVHDLHATILHLFGFNHEKFTYRYAGRDFRLTDVHGKVIRDVLA
jgi:hypothetical protein